MANLAAPALKWLSTPEPQSASTIVSQSTIAVVAVMITSNVLPAPEIDGGGGGAQPVGYAS